MPRQRTARLPVLDAPVRRSDGTSSRSGRAFRARLVAAALVLLSLGLITVYFRESTEGPLHTAQRLGASVLMPFEVAGERVARPFRDGWGYVSELVDAKSENAGLREEVKDLRQQVIRNETAAQENERLKEALAYIGGPSFPDDYQGVATSVIARPPSPYRQEVKIAAGREDGVRRNDPVVTADGLVGLVTEVTSGGAMVTLITDQDSAVSAVVLESGAPGVVRHGASEGSLVLDRVGKDALVEEGSLVVTAGWQTLRLESLYPRGIVIGTVESVGQQDVDLYKRIQVAPIVDFDSLADVIVLVRDNGKRDR
ncbi:MAG TPA: rod shape-determining protein MreC [Gaiellaceae bacterium]|nr:rod shape-determining protein MreC [Gaiellaceae bacterium]